MKFDLNVVNWLLHVSDPQTSLARLDVTDNGKQMFKAFFNQLDDAAVNSRIDEVIPDNLKSISMQLDSIDDNSCSLSFYEEIRNFLLQRKWLAVIFPSGMGDELDSMIQSPELLSFLVSKTDTSFGLVFKLDAMEERAVALLDVHNDFKTALKENVNWPGILIWIPGGNSVYLPIGSLNCLEFDIEARIQWVFSKLFSDFSTDLEYLRYAYKEAFPEVYETSEVTFHLLQMSELDIGSIESNFRMSRIKQNIRDLVEELGESTKISPVITGNLMENPSEQHIDAVHSFWDFLSGLGTEGPLLVFGNNDVRKDGNINESYRNAVGFLNSKIKWFEEDKLALICFNTVVHGNMANGSVGEDQIEAIKLEIERKKNSEQFRYVLLMHHLPVKHKAPAVSLKDFYSKVIGKEIILVDEMQNSERLLNFIQGYPVIALLHGHQKVPVIGKTQNNIPVLGCGKSVGEESKYNGSVYLNFNIISVNLQTNKISSRLIAIRKPEVGLSRPNRNEIIFYTNLA